MEVVKTLSTDVMTQLEATKAAFEPLLRAHQAEILATTRKTFKYGSTDRHQLDVYYPAHTESGSAPTLFFVYGGGYASGDKVHPPPAELVYRNTGTFFAKQGFVTVIADYRIFPNIQYPDPAIDIRDAMAWVVANIDEVNKDVPTKADVSRIFVMGHSAGAMTIATMLLEPGLIPPGSDLHKRLAGVILQGGVYHFRGAPALNPAVQAAYYGTGEQLRKREVMALFENAAPEVLAALPPVLGTASEFDAPVVVATHKDFMQLLKEKISSFEESVMRGHNHVSVHFAPMSGEGEEWCHEAVAWMKKHL